jgi:hypothetical protein
MAEDLAARRLLLWCGLSSPRRLYHGCNAGYLESALSSYRRCSIQRGSVKVPPPPPVPSPSPGDAASTQFEPQAVVVPPVTPPSIVATSSPSLFHVDTSKVIDQALNHLTDQMPKGSGMGSGTGSGTGTGSGSFWGSTSQGATSGFEGTFYDFTRRQGGTPNLVDETVYGNIIRAFCKDWKPPEAFPCYTSSTTLYNLHFFFPPIADTEAGKAFKTPSSTQAFWLAHYHGSFTLDAPGEYRFVGFGDNVLIVRINGTIVLDASDRGFIKGSPDYVSPYRKRVGDAILPGKDNGTPLYMGDSFIVEPGASIHIDIIIGDEGGIFCAGLFLAPKDPTLTFTSTGVPKLPLFGVGEMPADDKKSLGVYLPPECLVRPANFSIVPEEEPGL